MFLNFYKKTFKMFSTSLTSARQIGSPLFVCHAVTYDFD